VYVPSCGGQDDDDCCHTVKRRLDGGHRRTTGDVSRLGRQHPQLLEQLTMMHRRLRFTTDLPHTAIIIQVSLEWAYTAEMQYSGITAFGLVTTFDPADF